MRYDETRGGRITFAGDPVIARTGAPSNLASYKTPYLTNLQPRQDGSHPFSGMIRKLKSGQFRLYSRKKNPDTGKRRNLGTFATREKAEAHERAVQYFKRQ